MGSNVQFPPRPPSDSVPLFAEFLNVIAWFLVSFETLLILPGIPLVLSDTSVVAPYSGYILSVSDFAPFLGITFFEEVSDPLKRILRPPVGFHFGLPSAFVDFGFHSEISVAPLLVIIFPLTSLEPQSPGSSRSSGHLLNYQHSPDLSHYHDSAGVQLLPSVFLWRLYKALLSELSYMWYDCQLRQYPPPDSVGLRQLRSAGHPT